MTTKLRWRAERTTTVEVRLQQPDGAVRSLGSHPAHGELDVKLSVDGFFELEAHNVFGAVSERTNCIYTLPVPPLGCDHRLPRPDRGAPLPPVLLVPTPPRPSAPHVTAGWSPTTPPAAIRPDQRHARCS